MLIVLVGLKRGCVATRKGGGLEGVILETHVCRHVVGPDERVLVLHYIYIYNRWCGVQGIPGLL